VIVYRPARACDQPAGLNRRNENALHSAGFQDGQRLLLDPRKGVRTMRTLVFAIVTAALAIPAWAVAGTPPTPADKAAAVKQCTTERNAMGVPAFKLLYGTNTDRSNAFGTCVSKLAKQNAENRSNATTQCRTERAADPAAFATKYGTGKQHTNAFGNCVSGKAKAAPGAQVAATVKAAKSCWTERKADPAAFKAKYGTNSNKSDAFGKCVSGQVKHTP
jgi:carboxylesterase type B